MGKLSHLPVILGPHRLPSNLHCLGLELQPHNHWVCALERDPQPGRFCCKKNVHQGWFRVLLGHQLHVLRDLGSDLGSLAWTCEAMGKSLFPCACSFYKVRQEEYLLPWDIESPESGPQSTYRIWELALNLQLRSKGCQVGPSRSCWTQTLTPVLAPASLPLPYFAKQCFSWLASSPCDYPHALLWELPPVSACSISHIVPRFA